MSGFLNLFFYLLPSCLLERICFLLFSTFCSSCLLERICFLLFSTFCSSCLLERICRSRRSFWLFFRCFGNRCRFCSRFFSNSFSFLRISRNRFFCRYQNFCIALRPYCRI